MEKPSDLPTIARIRAKLNEFGSEGDITIDQVKYVVGVTTKAPIMLRLERGEILGAKVLGEWRVDIKSIHTYLDTINKNYNRSI